MSHNPQPTTHNVILKAENISKQYRLGTVGTGTLKDDLNRWWHRIRGKENPYLKIGEANDRSTKGTSDYVWALQDINFEVERGEVLGIIGKNGAGKSTLLKILSKVTAPTTGTIKSRGRIASLLEVGTGFNGELTGRENVYLNGAILGMTKKEITAKLDEIIEFSGCERYIDTPVKRYSSGMTVRLAFAVAAFLEPEILVIDEVLAVGDAEFQKKAIGKMQDISKGEGRTVLFVSHNMAAVKSLCTRGIVLEHGKVAFEGEINQVINFYMNKQNNFSFPNPVFKKINSEINGPKILQCELKNLEGDIKSIFSAGDIISLHLIIQPDLEVKKHYCAVWFIHDKYGEEFAVCSSGKMNNKFYDSETILIKSNIDSSGLLPGDYSIRLVLHIPGENNFDDWTAAINFNIISHDINKTGFEYTSIWSPKAFLKSEWE
ncbi:ABC transporter ATP-binding protein [Flavobacterium seoulense]|uniref:ABC transporter domain-containing protein n=1 Tax=Flavobacterium seoulense TaxID=1492738 RepID=A0A066WTG6_9FLAO|nr:ABC transporter ATP-binding protein [Flavobacterium seoulense]KDN53975.1 hypothetical protein FEM21_29130 [Flavobacterium seoulense]